MAVVPLPGGLDDFFQAIARRPPQHFARLAIVGVDGGGITGPSTGLFYGGLARSCSQSPGPPSLRPAKLGYARDYFTGDWLALARSPPVPPRSAQQSWATLATILRGTGSLLLAVPRSPLAPPSKAGLRSRLFYGGLPLVFYLNPSGWRWCHCQAVWMISSRP
jgi:hypothetical protein